MKPRVPLLVPNFSRFLTLFCALRLTRVWDDPSVGRNGERGLGFVGSFVGTASRQEDLGAMTSMNNKNLRCMNINTKVLVLGVDNP